MANPLRNSPALTAGEPDLPKSKIPVATGGKRQPITGGTRKIKVKGSKPHTRVIRQRQPAPAQQQPPPVQPDPLAAQINAAAELRYGPQIRNYDQQIGQSFGNQIRAGNWYTDYANQLKAQQDAQDQAAANVAAALAQAFGQVQAGPSTGNAQADALAAQAAQSRAYLGQAQAGTQSQLALNTANRFATGLIPAAQLSGQQAEQTEVNRRGQLQTALAQTRGEEAAYKTDLRSKAESDAAKRQETNAYHQALLALSQGRLDLATNILKNVTAPLASNTITNTQADNTRADKTAAESHHQNAVKNALAVNKLALNAYLKAHPELSKKGGKQGQSFTPTQIRSGEQKFRSVRGMLKEDYVQQHPELAIKRLVKEKKIDPLMARAVVQTIASGGVDRKTATAYYRAYGKHLKVNDLGEKTVGGVIKFVGLK